MEAGEDIERRISLTLQKEKVTLQQAISLRIQEICDTYGLTNNELARISGVSKATLSLYRNGLVSTVKLETLYRICAALDMPLTEFFSGDQFQHLVLPSSHGNNPEL